MEKRIAVGILAHVDAGKTTLTEALLYCSGNLKKLGRVDRGDAFLDTFALERARGITIFSKQALLPCGDTLFTLLDTPGHADFSAEAERTLQVLDYAILVISATDGVQSHTRTLWKLLRKYGVPCFLFVNKTDLPGRTRQELLAQLRETLHPGCTDFTDPAGTAFFEDAALCDEALLEEYETTGALVRTSLIRAVRERKLFPVRFGSALRLEGVTEFLQTLCDYTAAPADDGVFAARVFKLSEDRQGNRLTFLKVTGGTLRVREVLASEKNTTGEKVNQIRLYSGEKYTTAETAPAGTVAAVTGITCLRPGDGAGAARAGTLPVLTPVLSYSVLLPPGADPHRALNCLKTLEAEDPQLHVTWDARAGEIRLRLMGEIQLEILRAVLLDRFGLDVSFGRGSILYKETVETEAEGVGHFEPLRHYAEVHLLLKPGKRDSGLVFRAACREDQLDRNWQRLILTHLYEKTHVGVLTGAPITDMEITLVSGRAHPKHTEGGDFRQATYRALRQGLRRAKSILLEPIYDFTLEVPAENAGRALHDVERLHGTFDPPTQRGDAAVITGTAPAATFSDYGRDVAQYTRGRGKLTCAFRGYAPCHNADAVIAAASYDPDADTDNPCDSVFCAHGAGFTVKWDAVEDHMHLPSALAKPKPPEAARPAPLAPVRRNSGRPDVFALDRELMQIFEKTYGPVKDRSDPYNLYAPPKRVSQKKEKIPATYTGTEYLLVDGYNVIYAWEPLRRLSEGSMHDARDALINLLCNYRGYKQNEVILVFDAYKVKGDVREVETLGGISVVYTKEAETADSYIEKTSHALAKTNRVRVVTSDGMEQIIILGNGALRVSSESFYDELLAVQREIREKLESR